MSTAVRDPDFTTPVSSEASERIANARVRDLAFRIRQIPSARNIDGDDLELLARVILSGVDRHIRVDKTYVYNALKERGRSDHKARALTDTLFK